MKNNTTIKRVRFHGRGGQGMKTASRIVGTAAFMEGYYAQDFPVYGAERRGAPIMAFTRLSDNPILERGIITQPDINIIADETLLDDSTRLAANAATAGLDVRLDCFPEMQHVFQMSVGNTPEADDAVTRAAAWMRDRMGR